ncbi:hypothetical protein KW791_03390 [Candidatus Parcubacteria bacterium]|nr:hypothetical protein [Candidatus Parcubacteria bacterium]
MSYESLPNQSTPEAQEQETDESSEWQLNSLIERVGGKWKVRKLENPPNGEGKTLYGFYVNAEQIQETEEELQAMGFEPEDEAFFDINDLPEKGRYVKLYYGPTFVNPNQSEYLIRVIEKPTQEEELKEAA